MSIWLLACTFHKVIKGWGKYWQDNKSHCFCLLIFLLKHASYSSYFGTCHMFDLAEFYAGCPHWCNSKGDLCLRCNQNWFPLQAGLSANLLNWNVNKTCEKTWINAYSCFVALFRYICLVDQGNCLTSYRLLHISLDQHNPGQYCG